MRLKDRISAPKGILQMFLRRRVPERGPLKAAVIGVGAFGRHHCSKYQSLDDVELLAVSDPSADVRANAIAQYGVQAVADWRDLLGKVDLVSICTPAITHAVIVRAFLSAGAHVLVEKPIATTLRDADDLAALAAATGLVLTVGHQERFVFARMGLLDTAIVPREIQCWRRGPWTGRGDDVSAVLDLMIHDLDLAHALVQSPVRDVMAEGDTQYGPFADDITATVTFANGAVAHFDTSRIAPERKRGFRAIYDDGVIEIDFLTHTLSNTTPRALGGLEIGDPLGESVTSFVQAARDGAEPLVTAAQARDALKTALMIDEMVGPPMPVTRAPRIAAVG